jgi:hypothetical protein
MAAAGATGAWPAIADPVLDAPALAARDGRSATGADAAGSTWVVADARGAAEAVTAAG